MENRNDRAVARVLACVAAVHKDVDPQYRAESIRRWETCVTLERDTLARDKRWTRAAHDKRIASAVENAIMSISSGNGEHAIDQLAAIFVILEDRAESQ